jgi:23S rRNA pseudouridine1911/1915/1917 synthase
VTARQPHALIDVLFEDNHLLVLNKPAGLPTMGVSEDLPSLVREAKRYLKHKYQKPGNVYLGVVSRLDSVASGVVVFARTSKAAARLTEQFRSRHVEKSYWAIVPGAIEPPEGECVDWLLKDDAHRRMIVTRPNAPGAKEATLRYRRLALLGDASLLEIELETGRKHQIRLQLAAREFPILGDRKYGSRESFLKGRGGKPPAGDEPIALHARRLAIAHPVGGAPLEFTAPLPASWRAWKVPERF